MLMFQTVTITKEKVFGSRTAKDYISKNVYVTYSSVAD